MSRATCLALLRGVNVGGKNMLPMKNLVEMFVEAGCTDVRNYIQSGNVIFNASPDVMSRLPEQITANIFERFGFRTPVVFLTVDQLRDVCYHNPFLTVGVVQDSLYVMFLANSAAPADIETLDPDRSPGDAFFVRDHVVYLHLPNGSARSKLTNAYFDGKLSTVSTSRNWRTTNRLLAMMDGLA